MKDFFGYVRVSTVRQGEHSVSLPEQRDAITRYAARSGIAIARWFEERETASKAGRPVFREMLRLLRLGKARGVVIHKVDRSARNLTDWAQLADLIDAGCDVRIANDGIDLHSRGGRLAADIQAVVAADYSRNLREEVKKGMYGRLKQGLYPLAAPLGYLDCGGGKAKEPDPVMAPLVHQAFALYATGSYTLETLGEEMHRRGLRSRAGGRVSRNGLSIVLGNPFYVGVIRLRRSGQVFAGVHEPLIAKYLFDRVQDVLAGKTPHRTMVHDFAYRKLIRCHVCGYSLIGETRKGFVYYRCHTPTHTTSVREDTIRTEVLRTITSLTLAPEELDYAQSILMRMVDTEGRTRDAQASSVALRRNQLEARLRKLTDALLDELIDTTTFEERRATLLMERTQLDGERDRGPHEPASLAQSILAYLGLGHTALSLHDTWLPAERREFLLTVTSDRRASARNVHFTLAEPFRTIANRAAVTSGGPVRDEGRTWQQLIRYLWEWVTLHPVEGEASRLLSSSQDRQPEAA